MPDKDFCTGVIAGSTAVCLVWKGWSCCELVSMSLTWSEITFATSFSWLNIFPSTRYTEYFSRFRISVQELSLASIQSNIYLVWKGWACYVYLSACPWPDQKLRVPQHSLDWIFSLQHGKRGEQVLTKCFAFQRAHRTARFREIRWDWSCYRLSTLWASEDFPVTQIQVNYHSITLFLCVFQQHRFPNVHLSSSPLMMICEIAKLRKSEQMFNNSQLFIAKGRQRSYFFKRLSNSLKCHLFTFLIALWRSARTN